MVENVPASCGSRLLQDEMIEGSGESRYFPVAINDKSKEGHVGLTHRQHALTPGFPDSERCDVVV